MIYTAPLQQEATEMFRLHFWTLLMLSHAAYSRFFLALFKFRDYAVNINQRFLYPF